jgi:hypothetical protein
VTKLDAAHKDAILSVCAGVWLPMSVAMAHYRACDALGLPISEQVALGRSVGDRVQGTFLGTVLRAAKGVGATPWAALENVDRLWDRTFQGGGGATLVRMGPKEAISELIGLPALAVPYFRHAYRGAYLAAIELFCSKGYVLEVPKDRVLTSATFRLSWA